MEQDFFQASETAQSEFWVFVEQAGQQGLDFGTELDVVGETEFFVDD